MILKLAFRNLFSNKVKSIIIVGLIGLATFLTVLGFGILNYSKQQTETVCRSDFCADVFISGKTKKKKANVTTPTLFGPFATGVVTDTDDTAMPYLLQHERIIEKLKTIPGVADFSLGLSVSGILKPINAADNEFDYMVPDKIINAEFLGINPADHKRMYDSIKVYEGRIPESGAFLILPRDIVEKYEKKYNEQLHIGDTIALKAFSQKAKKIEMTISAFHDYAHPETDIDGIGYIDFNSIRILGNMTVGSQTATEIPDTIDLGVSAFSEDELFSDNVEITDISSEGKAESEHDLLNILGDTTLRDTLNMPDSSSWHYITVRLKEPKKAPTVIQELNTWFEKNDVEAQASDWETAMKFFFIRLQSTKVLMIVVLILLSIVSIVVIMNTMVVSTMERTGEIGTMRAIGAQKIFIRKLFVAESVILAAAGLLVGIILAVLIGGIFNISGVHANDMVTSLFGFSVIRVSLKAGNMIMTAAIIMAASLFATIYPLALALHISPLEAINKN